MVIFGKKIEFNVKVSLKTYLFSLCFALIILVGGIIIGLNYITFGSANIKASEEILMNYSSVISTKVNDYFNIVETGVRNGILLIQEKHDLLGFLQNNKLINAVYEADLDGNFYMVQRIANDQFATVRINRANANADMVESVVNQQGQAIKTTSAVITQYDPRNREWYKKVLQEKKPGWTNIYRFYAFSNISPDLGVTLSVPIFDQSGVLIKVFAVDVSLNFLASYLSNINAGEDSAVYLVDPEGNIKYLLLSKNVLNSANFSHSTISQNLDDLNLPWAKEAVTQFKQIKKNHFLYQYDHNKYMAAALPLPVMSNWHLLSVKSLSSLLNLYTIYSRLVIGLGALLIALGIAGSAILIIRLNAPIKQLFKSISDLRELRFQDVKYPSSNIKEIGVLYETLNFMENGFKSFARYVPMALIQKLMSSGTVAEVYGESREITVLFTDIRSFSSIAENMQPRELMFYLSEYFEGMTNVIMSKGGTLDKYIGDAIMSFWGAPYDDKNHALHACQCALLLQGALDRLNKAWKQKGLPELSMRFGINTGYSVVGNVGSRYRLSYTAMGDSVNLASRLEELNKEYGTSILVGEDTYRAVSDQFLFRMVDLVEARGKKESVYIYELLLREQSKFSPAELKTINAKFRDAFNVYRVGEWERALNMFDELLKEYPDDRITLMFIDRCKKLRENPPKNWTGAWSFPI